MKKLFQSKITLIVLLVTLFSLGVEGQTSSMKVYNKHGLYFTYPSTYTIEEEIDDDGMLSLTCEINGSDFSQIVMTLFANNLLTLLDSDDKMEMCKTSLEAMRDELKANSMFEQAKCGPIQPCQIAGSHAYQASMTNELLGISMNGKLMAVAKGDKLVTIVTLYENDNYKRALEEIIQSLKL